MPIEVLAQQHSTGILYEPYRDAFKQCVYEEAGVQGRNERYEFRCDTSLECCGRVCCIPDETLYFGMPLWLLLLFLALALLLLLSLLYLLYRLCCRKRKQKKVTAVRRRRDDGYRDINRGYRSIKHADDYDALPNGHGHGQGFGANPRRSSFHEEETVEESFKEEIEVERRRGSVGSGGDSFRRMEEKLLDEPQPLRVTSQEIAGSRQSLATSADVVVPEPQRAQHAYYRPFVPDKMEEVDIPVAQHLNVSTRDIADLMGSSQLPAYSTLEKPMKSAASHMYLRPGFDNVPSY